MLVILFMVACQKSTLPKVLGCFVWWRKLVFAKGFLTLLWCRSGLFPISKMSLKCHPPPTNKHIRKAGEAQSVGILECIICVVFVNERIVATYLGVASPMCVRCPCAVPATLVHEVWECRSLAHSSDIDTVATRGHPVASSISLC